MSEDLQYLLTPPDNWQWGEFHNRNSQHIRYGWNCPENARGLIIFAEGRTEVIEEYFENIRYFNAKGYATAIMDWQGQGLSYRLTGDNTRHHSVGFEQDVADFQEFLDILDREASLNALPKILLAHSMGGNIALRFLAENPDAFKCAAMTAPMLGLNPKRTIRYLAPVILGIAKKMGKMEKYAPGQSAWNERIAHLAKYKVSSDPLRRELQPHLFKTHPALQCGGVTYGWLAHALDSIALLQRQEVASTIKTPLFFAIADNDIVVDNQGTERVISHLPRASVQRYHKAEHQIHREQDPIRLRLLEDIECFIKKHL